jgi:hypothetical protein
LVDQFCFEAHGVNGAPLAYGGFEHWGVFPDVSDEWGLDHLVSPLLYHDLYWVVEVVIVLPSGTQVLTGSWGIWSFDRFL